MAEILCDTILCKDCEQYRDNFDEEGVGFCNLLNTPESPVFLSTPWPDGGAGRIKVVVKDTHGCDARKKRVVRYRLKEPIVIVEYVGTPDGHIAIQGAGLPFVIRRGNFASICEPIPPEEAP